MCVDARAVAAAISVKPEPVPETAGAHIFEAHETDSGYVKSVFFEKVLIIFNKKSISH